jgi:hypothetical protein
LFWAFQPKQAAKITRQPMPPAAPAVLRHSLDTRQGASNIILAMTRRDVGKPAFSLRKKRFVKTHALSLLRTKNLRYAMLRFQDFRVGIARLEIMPASNCKFKLQPFKLASRYPCHRNNPACRFSISESTDFV